MTAWQHRRQFPTISPDPNIYTQLFPSNIGTTNSPRSSGSSTVQSTTLVTPLSTSTASTTPSTTTTSSTSSSTSTSTSTSTSNTLTSGGLTVIKSITVTHTSSSTGVPIAPPITQGASGSVHVGTLVAGVGGTVIALAVALVIFFLRRARKRREDIIDFRPHSEKVIDDDEDIPKPRSNPRPAPTARRHPASSAPFNTQQAPASGTAYHTSPYHHGIPEYPGGYSANHAGYSENHAGHSENHAGFGTYLSHAHPNSSPPMLIRNPSVNPYPPRSPTSPVPPPYPYSENPQYHKDEKLIRLGPPTGFDRNSAQYSSDSSRLIPMTPIPPNVARQRENEAIGLRMVGMTAHQDPHYGQPYTQPQLYNTSPPRLPNIDLTDYGSLGIAAHRISRGLSMAHQSPTASTVVPVIRHQRSGEEDAYGGIS